MPETGRDATVVVVRADEPLRATSEASAEELGQRLASRGLDVVPRGQGVVADPEAALSAIEAFFYALSMERTESEARGFIEALERGEFGLVAPEHLIRALLFGAQANAALGDGPASDAAIDRALRLDGALVLDPGRHSPVPRARVEARRAQRPSARHEVVVTGAPDDARVYVDGRNIADARTHAVAPGRTLVQIEAPGYARQTRVIEVTDEDVTVAFEATRTPESIDAIAGAPDQPLPSETDALLATLGWDPWLLDARVVDGRAVYRWWRPGSLPITVEVPLETPADRVAEMLDDAERGARADASRALRRDHRRRVAAWVSGAVAVAAGGLTAGLLLRPLDANGWRGQGTIEDGE